MIAVGIDLCVYPENTTKYYLSHNQGRHIFSNPKTKSRAFAPAFFGWGLIVDAFRTVEWGRIKKELLEIDVWEQGVGLSRTVYKTIPA